jgi:hypothetical protein
MVSSNPRKCRSSKLQKQSQPPMTRAERAPKLRTGRRVSGTPALHYGYCRGLQMPLTVNRHRPTDVHYEGFGTATSSPSRAKIRHHPYLLNRCGLCPRDLLGHCDIYNLQPNYEARAQTRRSLSQDQCPISTNLLRARLDIATCHEVAVSVYTPWPIQELPDRNETTQCPATLTPTLRKSPLNMSKGLKIKPLCDREI